MTWEESKSFIDLKAPYDAFIYHDILQAFADELVKRIRINHGGLVTTDIVQERINELLTEAGVER